MAAHSQTTRPKRMFSGEYSPHSRVRCASIPWISDGFGTSLSPKRACQVRSPLVTCRMEPAPMRPMSASSWSHSP